MSAHLAYILGPLYYNRTISLSAHLTIRGTLYYIYTISLSAHSLSAHFFWNASCALNEALLYMKKMKWDDDDDDKGSSELIGGHFMLTGQAVLGPEAEMTSAVELLFTF